MKYTAFETNKMLKTIPFYNTAHKFLVYELFFVSLKDIEDLII